jgi:UDPglucose 6-dehydrogenase
MNIGIIGLGIVGSAVKYGLEKLGHTIFVHDIKFNTNVEIVLNTEVCFICVPTPSNEDGSCNTTIVEKVVGELQDNNYNGIIALKSTVKPETTEKLIKQYINKNNKICFVPEFLRERCAIADFTENHDICIVGTHSNDIFEKIKLCHGHYPKQFFKLIPTEAELCKYFNNNYNTTLVTFANSFYEICKACNADYGKIKNVMVNRGHITDIYLDANENFRGFGGPCLPKDCKAMAQLCEEKNLSVKFFHDLLEENHKYKTTVFKGMRE